MQPKNSDEDEQNAPGAERSPCWRFPPWIETEDPEDADEHVDQPEPDICTHGSLPGAYYGTGSTPGSTHCSAGALSLLAGFPIIQPVSALPGLDRRLRAGFGPPVFPWGLRWRSKT